MFSARFGPLGYNSSPIPKSRFSPIRHEGRIVPSIYAGSSLEAALFETVLRDKAAADFIFEGTLRDKRFTTILANEPLRLIDLYPPGCHKLGLEPAELIGSDPACYARTAAWAAALHEANPSAQGMKWRSRQNPHHDAVVLWGDRIDDGIIEAAGIGPLDSGEGLQRLAQIAELFGLTLAVDD